MRYAISYVSTAHIDLQEQGLQDIMKKTNKFNKEQGITGILLHNERNFFQLIEGEKKTVQDLYVKILQDFRHHDVIQFLEEPIFKPSFDGYLTDFITDTKKHDESKLQHYFSYIEALNPDSQKAIRRVMQLMMV